MAAQPLPSISPMRGPYRDARMPSLIALATHASWSGIGDPDQVHDLVRGIPAIGRRRNVGEGVVLRWTIETPKIPENTWFEWAHTASTAKLVRPVPHECATQCGLATEVEPVSYAIRPPSWHPDRVMTLAASREEAW